MNNEGLFSQGWMLNLTRVAALVALLGLSAMPAFAAPDFATDSKNNCKLYPNSYFAMSRDYKITKSLGTCVEGWYEGQIVYGVEYKEDRSAVMAGTMVNGQFKKGISIAIVYDKGGTPWSFSVYEGTSLSKSFGSGYEDLKKALDEIYRLTDMGGDNHNPANRELLLNVINKHIKNQYGFYNEFIKGTGNTGIAINAPFTPTPTPAAELPDDPQVLGASASPNDGKAKVKGKKKK